MAGFQAFNDAGALQFDADWISYGFKQKGTVTAVSTPMNGESYLIAKVTVSSANYPLVFLNGVQRFYLFHTYQNGTYWEFSYIVDPTGSGSLDFTYYVFDKMSNPGTYGLELYNAAGQLTFTSNQAPLELIYAAQAPDIPAGQAYYGNEYNVSIPAMYGKTCAVMLAGARVEYQQISGNGYFNYVETIRPVSDGIRLAWYEEWVVFHEGAVGNNPIRQGGQSFILVANVTGL